jgi:hypothetical protein
MSKVSIMCKKDYLYNDKVCLVKGNIYTVDERSFNEAVKSPIGTFYDYFYTQEEMRSIRLKEIGI